MILKVAESPAVLPLPRSQEYLVLLSIGSLNSLILKMTVEELAHSNTTRRTALDDEDDDEDDSGRRWNFPPVSEANPD